MKKKISKKNIKKLPYTKVFGKPDKKTQQKLREGQRIQGKKKKKANRLGYK